MRQIIGFDRRIQLDWLDATVALCREDLKHSIIAKRLDQHLASEISGIEARRKTITVLSRVWVNASHGHKPLRDEALQLATHISLEERLWLHWGMSLLAYPFFRDVASTVGKLSRLQGVLSQAQVQRRMIERWGQRTTLQRATQRLLRTFIDWNVLTDTDVRGRYEVAPPERTANRTLALWLLNCALRANGAEQIPLAQLSQLPCAFAFDLLPFANDIRRSERFEVTRQGPDLEMVAVNTTGM